MLALLLNLVIGVHCAPALQLINVGLDMGGPSTGIAGAPEKLDALGLSTDIQSLGVNLFNGVDIRQNASLGNQTGYPYIHEDAVMKVVRSTHNEVVNSLNAGRIPLVIGGDHSLALGSVSGAVRYARENGKNLGVIWVDAHTDLYLDYYHPEKDPFHLLRDRERGTFMHAVVMNHLLGRGLDEHTSIGGIRAPILTKDKIAFFGLRDSISTDNKAFQKDFLFVPPNLLGHPAVVPGMVASSLGKILDESDMLHLSFDFDVIDPSDMESVDCPVDGGISARVAREIVSAVARSGRLTSMDFVEFNPARDRTGRDSKLAKSLILEAVHGLCRVQEGD